LFQANSTTARFVLLIAKGTSSRCAAFLRATVVIDTDAQTSEQYGRIRAELAEAGRPIPENDIWIAAVALQHGWPLATRDEHFGRITGLEILSW
jgi:tRNA(fMet)-specific endonuclease VapC